MQPHHRVSLMWPHPVQCRAFTTREKTKKASTFFFLLRGSKGWQRETPVNRTSTTSKLQAVQQQRPPVLNSTLPPGLPGLRLSVHAARGACGVWGGRRSRARRRPRWPRWPRRQHNARGEVGRPGSGRAGGGVGRAHGRAPADHAADPHLAAAAPWTLAAPTTARHPAHKAPEVR